MAVSTKSIKRLSKAERSTFILPNYIKEVLFGLMLSDGNIQRRFSTANSRFLFSQSVENEAFFWHIFN